MWEFCSLLQIYAHTPPPALGLSLVPCLLPDVGLITDPVSFPYVCTVLKNKNDNHSLILSGVEGSRSFLGVMPCLAQSTGARPKPARTCLLLERPLPVLLQLMRRLALTFGSLGQNWSQHVRIACRLDTHASGFTFLTAVSHQQRLKPLSSLRGLYLYGSKIQGTQSIIF